MANLPLIEKYKAKMLFWSVGDLLSPYLNAADSAAQTAALTSLVGGLAPVQTKDVEITFEGDTVEQETDGVSWGADKKFRTSDKVKITGKIALAGSGTAGAAPAYRELFLLSGHAEVIDAANKTVTYTPITEGFDYGTIGFVQGGKFHVGYKAQIELKLDANAGELGYWDFEIYMVSGTIPIAKPAGLNAVVSGYQTPKAVNFGNTPIFQLGGLDFVMKSFNHTTGNEVTSLDLVNHQSAVIGDRKPTSKITVGAKDLSAINLHQRAWDGDEMAMVVEHGKTAGEKVRLQYPAVSADIPAYADIDGALGYDIELTAMQHADGPYQIIFS